MAGKIAAVSTGSASIGALAKGVATATKGAPIADSDANFESALSRAMPAARSATPKNGLAKTAAAKNASAKGAPPKAQPSPSAEPETPQEPTQAVESGESAEAKEPIESAEARESFKPSGRKGSRSAEDRETSPADSRSDIDPNVDPTAIAAVQANQTDPVPVDPTLAEVKVNPATLAASSIQTIEPWDTQDASDVSAKQPTTKLPYSAAQGVLDGYGQEPAVSAESDVAAAAEQNDPAAVESGIPIELEDAAAEVEARASAISEALPEQEEAAASRLDVRVLSSGEKKRIAAAESDEQRLAESIVSSESEQADQVSQGEQADGVDAQPGQSNGLEAQGDAAASDKTFLREGEDVSAKPAAKVVHRAPAETSFSPGPASHVEQTHKPAASAAPPSMESRFAEANHPKIVTAVRSELVPHGGSMQIRLDPPELGALQVRVEMRDGVLAASFQTVNDDATQLLSHSLHQLKTALEAQGVSVERLHVEQVPREKLAGGTSEDGQQQQQPQDHASQQEQQRREMLQRMWRRLAGDKDPLDLMA